MHNLKKLKDLKKPLNPRNGSRLNQNDPEMVKQDAVSDTKNKSGDVTNEINEPFEGPKIHFVPFVWTIFQSIARVLMNILNI